MISGRVQGVGYRAWCQTEAMSLGLAGWVRNRRDGGVEAVFSGAPDEVDEMLRRVWRGPPGARIASLDVTDADAGADAEFHVLPTA